MIVAAAIVPRAGGGQTFGHGHAVRRGEPGDFGGKGRIRGIDTTVPRLAVAGHEPGETRGIERIGAQGRNQGIGGRGGAGAALVAAGSRAGIAKAAGARHAAQLVARAIGQNAPQGTNVGLIGRHHRLHARHAHHPADQHADHQ